MDNEQIEAAFSVRGTNYKVRITVRQADVFNVLLLDEDIPDRWSGDFTGSFIEEMTRATGSFKRVSVFWKMLQVAISGTSEEVSLNILSQQDILALQKKSQLSSSSLKPTDDKKYLVITQSTQFDSVKYPLMLVRKPYTNDELCAIIRGLKSENRRLLTRITQPPKQKDEIHSLEMQIYEINNTLKKVTEEKDAIINSLRRKISILEKNIINPQPKNQHLQSRNSQSKYIPLYERQFLPKVNTKSRNSSAQNRKPLQLDSKRNYSSGSSRSSSVKSNSSRSSYKRFDPTEWVRTHKSSSNSSRDQSPVRSIKRRKSSPTKRNGTRSFSPTSNPKRTKYMSRNNRDYENNSEQKIKRLHSLIQQKYHY